jgi:hypothetical protein
MRKADCCYPIVTIEAAETPQIRVNKSARGTYSIR